jgi:hypothetical protein
MPINANERVRLGARLRHAREASRLSYTWRATSEGARILRIAAPGLPDPQRVVR